MTGRLLPKLAEHRRVRVVITSSVSHRSGEIDWADLNAERGYDKWARYSMSKLANLLFLFELDRRLRAAGSPVIAAGCHPGFAMTDFGRHMPVFAALTPVLRLFANTAAGGAGPALQAATGPVTPGGYYGPSGFVQIRGPSGAAKSAPQAHHAAKNSRMTALLASSDMADLDSPAPRAGSPPFSARGHPLVRRLARGRGATLPKRREPRASCLLSGCISFLHVTAG